MQAVLGKAVVLTKSKEGCIAFLLPGAGDGTGNLPGWIRAHRAQAPLPFGEDCVVELPACFQMRAQAGSLALVDLQRPFEQKGRRAFPRLLAPVCCGLALLAHESLICCLLRVERLFQE